ncbi:MAG: eCIS core domain-containing protein [Chloroflexia bacterium]
MNDPNLTAQPKPAAVLLTPSRAGILQRAAVHPGPAPEVPPIVHDVLRSPGQPLDAGTRAFMEPRFGHDFSGVRVHTDGRATQSAGAVNALAYTVGRDVVFGAGQYAPGTRAGRQLLAHELTHVVQQATVQPPPAAFTIGPSGGRAEREADQAARSFGEHIGHTVAHVPTQLQKMDRSEDDPMHRPLIEDFRRTRGLPAGGVDESGQRVGPSDAEIKYGQGSRQVQVTAPVPPPRSVTASQAWNLAQQPLPPNVTLNSSAPAPAVTGAAAPTPAPQGQPAPRRLITPLPNQDTQFGLDFSGDTTLNLQISAVARGMNGARFQVGAVPIDILHEPTFNLGLSLKPSSMGVVAASVALSGLNLHFQQHGRDLIELAVAQMGLGFDSRGNFTAGIGAQAEIHSLNPHFSIFLSTGGSMVSDKSGNVTFGWTPITFGLLIHAVNP